MLTIVLIDLNAGNSSVNDLYSSVTSGGKYTDNDFIDVSESLTVNHWDLPLPSPRPFL